MRHIFIGIIEYVGKVYTFQSFDPVNCFGDVGTVDSTGASVRKFCYSTEKIPEYKWLSRRLKLILTLRRLTSYIYGAPILDVSRSHTTTQHSR